LRIAYLCQYFVPEPAAPAARVHEFSRAWTRAGEQVTVVTAFPNFPTGVIPPAYRRRPAMTERVDGIRVLRSWVYATPNRGVANRTASQLSFASSSLLLGLPRLGPVDVVVASSPPLFAALAGWLMARLRRAPYVLEVRDLWPEAMVDVGVVRHGVAVRALGALAWFLYRRADRVVVVTEGFADHLAARGLPRCSIAVVPNGADTRLFSPTVDGRPTRAALGLEPDRLVVAYLGSHGLSQGLDTVLDAAELAPRATFLLVGDGADKARLRAERDRRRLANVRMLPSIPKAQVPGLYAAADVGLVPLRDVPIFATFVPSKLFELLAAGRPIVGAVRGEARAILERSGAALVTDPEDGTGVAAAVRRLAADPRLRAELGRRGRAFAEAHYDRDALAERYLRLLRDVARGRP
jgi:glycosyltransferase involved in cell wall biosynthesis